MGLNERQTAIFAALVLCQPDSAGSGLLSTSTHLQQASLLKMLQQKLWVILQSALFPHSQLNGITGSLLNQSLFAAFADLRSLNTRHQEHLQNIVAVNSVLLKNGSNGLEQQFKCNENENVLSEIKFLPKVITAKDDSMTAVQKLQIPNEIFNHSMFTNLNTEQKQLGCTTQHSKMLTKSNNLIEEDRKRSSSSPPLLAKPNYYMNSNATFYNCQNNQNLNSTATSSSSQHDFLAALAVVATSKEFAQLNGNSLNDSSLKLTNKNDFVNTQGEDKLVQAGGLCYYKIVKVKKIILKF